MVRYLNESELKTRLKLGKSVEQWLGAGQIDDYTVIKWLSIEHERGQLYNVVYLEVFDEGDEDFTDIVEFLSVDPDAEYGVVNTFSSVDEALQFVQDQYKASLNKFVSDGMISFEYIDFLKTRQ